MDFIRAISATKDDTLEEVLETELSNVRLSVVRFQEQLEEQLMQDSNFNVILLKETFALNCHPMSIIKSLRETYPHIRIIYIMTSTSREEVDKHTMFLHSKQVYDIIQDNEFGREELIAALFNPKTSEQALRSSQKVSFEDEFNNLNAVQNSMNDSSSYQQEKHTTAVDINYNNNVKYSFPSPRVVSFWSPKGGVGVDTLAIQTAFMLARNTNIDVCIADLSDSPNMHLHLNMKNVHKNMEALYFAQANGKLNPYTVDEYIINGADTQFKLPNLHILPGATNRINFYRSMSNGNSGSFVGDCLESIIDVLREKYTVVILILSSHFYNIPTFAGLKKCSQINMVLENDASGFYNANRHLAPETGIFNACKIEAHKCKLILNKNYVQDSFYIDSFKKITGLDVAAKVGLYPEEAYLAYKKADPEQLTVKSDSAKNDILSVVNTITYMEFENVQPEQSSKQGFNIFKAWKK